MSDPTDRADPTADRPVPGEGEDLVVDLAAFLPDGVTLGDPDDPIIEDEPTTTSSDGPDSDQLDQIEADLDGVDRALVALDGGTYGTCATCGDPIADADLAADPTRTSCATHLAGGR